MKIYKISQSAPFYNWFTNQLLTLTDNHKKPLEQHYSPEVISVIADEFGNLSEEELNKLSFNDLYILNYLKNGVSSTKWLEGRSISERISKADGSWIYEASKKFPELLSSRVIPPLLNIWKKTQENTETYPKKLNNYCLKNWSDQ